MKYLPFVVAITLSGCGGGGGNSNSGNAAPVTTTTTGVVVDFYLSGSTVSFANASCAVTVTNDSGEFILPASTCGAMTVTGGTDVVTGLPFKGTFAAPAGSTVVSPITSLIQALIEAGTLPEQAHSSVMTALGLSRDPTTTDPLTDPEALAHTMALVQIAQQLAEVFSRGPTGVSGNFQDIHASVLKNVAKALPATGVMEFDADFVTAVAEATARELAPGGTLAANTATAVGPAVSIIARAAAGQIHGIRPELVGTNGDAVKALALVMKGSNVDDNVRVLTQLATSLVSVLAKNDLLTENPFALAQQITTVITALLVKPPVLAIH